MTQNSCAACRAAPASIFCSADAAFLCTPCDTTIHDANKLSRRHTRVPLDLMGNLAIQSADPETIVSTKESFREEHSPGHTWSGATAFDESDVSSELLVVPGTDHFDPLSFSESGHKTYKPLVNEDVSTVHSTGLFSLAPNMAQEKLASIAGACVKKEAQQLLESSKGPPSDSHFAHQLGLSWMRELAPSMADNIYSQNVNGVKKESHTMECVDDDQKVPTTPDNTILSRNGHFDGASYGLANSPVTGNEKAGGLTEGISSPVGSDGGPFEEFERTDEQKRHDRQAALQRFRHKRANRSFRKKVRYECRKQLADSRPRVKGRFVGRSKTTGSGRIQKSFVSDLRM